MAEFRQIPNVASEVAANPKETIQVAEQDLSLWRLGVAVRSR
ncbi:hypothetical protein [Nitrosomonas nitrosa]|nr:hypothetical protein [Nitrosomonas nitrosa]